MSDHDDAFDIDEFLDGYKPRRKTVSIYARGDLADEHARLETELGEVATAGTDEAVDRSKELVERIAAVKAELEASAREFTVEACSHDEWYELMVRWPPTEDERKDRPNAAVGAEFQCQAIARCLVAPEVSAKQVRKMRASLRPDDFDRLWMAVIEVVEGEVVVPKSGLATVVADLFERSSTPPPNRAQRRRSSSGDVGKRSPNTTTTKTAG